MPDDLENQGGVAVADPPTDTAEPAAEPPAGESGRQESQPDPARMSADLNGFMRGLFGQDPGATSKPGDEGDEGVQSDPDASGDEAASSPERGPDGRFIPRRGIPKAVEERDARIAELERQLAERDPEQIRAQIKAQDAQQSLSEQQRQHAELFEQSCRMADTDDRLNGPAPDGSGTTLYQWREARKELIAQYPEAEAALRADAEQRVASTLDGWRADQRRDIAAGAAEWGVDADRWKQPGTTWLSMTRDAVEAVASPLRSRIAELERDLHNARTGGLGAARAPVTPGRSAPGAAPKTMNDWFRGA